MKEELEVSYFDAKYLVDDVVSVDFNIVTPLHQQLQLCTTLTTSTMLCIVAYALNILNIYLSTRNNVRDFFLDKDRHKQ